MNDDKKRIEEIRAKQTDPQIEDSELLPYAHRARTASEDVRFLLAHIDKLEAQLDDKKGG